VGIPSAVTWGGTVVVVVVVEGEAGPVERGALVVVVLGEAADDVPPAHVSAPPIPRSASTTTASQRPTRGPAARDREQASTG
jgi:hypothetical protein